MPHSFLHLRASELPERQSGEVGAIHNAARQLSAAQRGRRRTLLLHRHVLAAPRQEVHLHAMPRHEGRHPCMDASGVSWPSVEQGSAAIMLPAKLRGQRASRHQPAARLLRECKQANSREQPASAVQPGRNIETNPAYGGGGPVVYTCAWERVHACGRGQAGRPSVPTWKLAHAAAPAAW